MRYCDPFKDCSVLIYSFNNLDHSLPLVACSNLRQVHTISAKAPPKVFHLRHPASIWRTTPADATALPWPTAVHPLTLEADLAGRSSTILLTGHQSSQWRTKMMSQTTLMTSRLKVPTSYISVSWPGESATSSSGKAFTATTVPGFTLA